MKSTFKVLFYLKKDKISKDGKVPVMGRITVNGTQAGFSCKLNIDPALWDEKTNYLKSQRNTLSREIHQMLENIKAQIAKHYQSISDRDAYVTANKVKNAYHGFGDRYKTLIAAFVNDRRAQQQHAHDRTAQDGAQAACLLKKCVGKVWFHCFRVGSLKVLVRCRDRGIGPKQNGIRSGGSRKNRKGEDRNLVSS